LPYAPTCLSHTSSSGVREKIKNLKLLANIPAAPGKPKDGKKPKESDEKNDTRKFRFNRNMGGYCHSCGYHPITRKHDSKTCKTKKEGHDNDATWANHGPNGCNWWPSKNKVNDKDKEHASYKNKEKPTN
jgi:hypothetical protein